MSKDIRSFFTVVSKKSSGSEAPKIVKPKKAVALIDSDDEEIIEKTPKKEKTSFKHSKRRAQVLSSDSEGEPKEKKSKNKSPAKKLGLDKLKKEEKPKLKPVDLDIFNKPIKQSEVEVVSKGESSKKSEDHNKEKEKKKKKNRKNPEIGVHKDKDFEKTLEQLDEDSDDTILLDNLDILDKTIEEASQINEDKIHTTESALKEAEKHDKKNGNNEKHRNEEPIKKDEETKTPKKAAKRPRKNSESTPTPKKKQKLEHTDSGIDQDLEKWQAKRQSAGLYVAYLHRGGPKHHGEKEYPKGKPDCLSGLTFLRTGVLDSLEGEEFQNLVTDHGGRVVHAVSKKVNYLVVGEEPGPSKLEKARKYNIPEIDEDKFLDMILVKSGMKPRYVDKVDSEDLGIGGSEEGSPPKSDKKVSPKKEQLKLDNTESPKKSKEKDGKLKEEHKIHIKQEKFDDDIKPNFKKLIDKQKDEDKIHIKKEKLDDDDKESLKKKASIQTEKETVVIKKEPNTQSEVKGNEVNPGNLSWTDKYKPTSIKGIIGQQDPNSNMNKLKKWLENWFKNQQPERRKTLPKPNPYNQHDGAYFKAALLSGGPGVGKTTTATLVAKELGFDIVEFNASDTRNKKLLHEEISQMMNSKTVAGFALGKNNMNQKRILLMDEVDGMAGNEDRGGIAELINFIKTANFPIICMCNNRDLPKMRSLVNHCYALKFGKPNVVQVRGAMMSICFKEGLQIKPDALAQLITGTGCDIRQTLNHLSMWSAAEKNLSAETVQKESKNSQKDVVFGAWDVIRKVFNKNEHEGMTLADKSRLFFYDYSFGPMFVQENYLSVVPECNGSKKSKSLETLIRRQLTADCLSRSDLIESKIRSTNNWSLLESQAFMSTVFPMHYLSGTMGQVRFPGWFGKNSQRNKSLRMVSELHSHARTSISGDKFSVRLDYAGPLLNRVLKPLKEKQADGIDETLEVMKSYSMLREDLSNLCELMTCFKNKKNPFDSVSASVKSALTRKYNKTVVLNFAPPAASKKKKNALGDQDDLLGEEEEFSDDDEKEDNLDDDGLIKVKTTKNSAQAGTSKASSSQSKAKGKSTKSSDSKPSKGKSKK